MAIIKLTETDSCSSFEQKEKRMGDKPIWVNTSKIDLFENGYIHIGERVFIVKETPEEILRLIKEAENEALIKIKDIICLQEVK